MEQTSYVYDSRKRVNKTLIPCLPGSIYLSSSEAVCYSYNTGVRLTFALTFKLSASFFPVLSPTHLPTSCCSSASEFDLL